MAKSKLLTVTKDDCDWQTFRAGGKGGQNQNKRDTGVRCIHRPSGAVGEARDERSQDQNKRRAFRRMAESTKFRLWLNRVVAEVTTGKTLDERVDEAMGVKNLRIQVREEGKWVDAQD